MKKLLFKTLFYTIIFTIRVSKKLGYPISVSLHNVPLEFIPKSVNRMEIIQKEKANWFWLEEKNLAVFLKDYPFPF